MDIIEHVLPSKQAHPAPSTQGVTIHHVDLTELYFSAFIPFEHQIIPQFISNAPVVSSVS